MNALKALEDSKGLVEFGKVPRLLVEELRRWCPDGVTNFPLAVRVPSRCFELESDILAPGSLSGSPCDMVQLTTVPVADGSQLPMAIAAACQQARTTGYDQCVAALFCYLDDANTLFYGPRVAGRGRGRPAGTGRGPPSDITGGDVAHCYLLALLVVTQSAGLLEAWNKLVWPSAAPQTVLGISVTLDYPRVTLQVSPAKRFNTALRWGT